jgi:hypothetical protein
MLTLFPNSYYIVKKGIKQNMVSGKRTEKNLVLFGKIHQRHKAYSRYFFSKCY